MLWPNGTKTKPTVTDTFRCREFTNGVCTRFHYGVDLVGFSQVKAVAAGTVSHVGYRSGWAGGFMVWIDHDGFSTRSLHLVNNSAPVSVGQAVAEGQVIGTMGATDSPGGVHLHLEVVVGGTQIDPVPFITDRLNTPPTPDPQPQEDDEMPINFRDQGTGISYTLVPFQGLTAHLNAFGARMTTYAQTGVWPSEAYPDEERERLGERQFSHEQVGWLLAQYGFLSIAQNLGLLPAPSSTRLADHLL